MITFTITVEQGADGQVRTKFAGSQSPSVTPGEIQASKKMKLAVDKMMAELSGQKMFSGEIDCGMHLQRAPDRRIVLTSFKRGNADPELERIAEDFHGLAKRMVKNLAANSGVIGAQEINGKSS
jgi:hypothetical protein